MCFGLTSEGLERIEVVPGIDIGRDILALMGFRPIVRSPKAIDASIFIQLDAARLSTSQPSAVGTVDVRRERNTLFLGLDGYRVHKPADVEAIREGILAVFARRGAAFPRSSTMTYRTLRLIWPTNGFPWPRTSSEHVTIMFRAT